MHVQLGCIAQGLLQHVAVNLRAPVWGGFRSWMRTMRPEATPSEAVVAQALRASVPDLPLAGAEGGILKKFLRRILDWKRVPGLVLASLRPAYVRLRARQFHGVAPRILELDYREFGAASSSGYSPPAALVVVGGLLLAFAQATVEEVVWWAGWFVILEKGAWLGYLTWRP